ncbi:hypothetical protein [Streptomyces sp. MMBL 11-1]|uniref:hypothetical protein n=1 Tax=Streptomyces sp. MMBL 11-1 TaxID=3026420 RepID=UPI00235FD28C|nr:hypothetical protein [Streptomyces sp. MMBL 11-1]
MNKIAWGPAPARDRKVGLVGKRRLFLVAPGNKLGDEPGDFRLYLYFPADSIPVGGDGLRVRSEAAAMELAEELLRDFYREMKRHMEPAKPRKATAAKEAGSG